MKIQKEEKYLIAELDDESDILSWSILNGGRSQGRNIFWAKVFSSELPRSVRPSNYLKDLLLKLNKKSDIAFMTSANLNDYTHQIQVYEQLKVEVLVTVGMGNSLRVGDKGGHHISIGTINILVEINTPMSESCLVEGVSIITEAKTAAVMDSRIFSKVSGKIATGTGTDCIALSSKNKNTSDSTYIYCGKHTKLGELIGNITYNAVSIGIEKWKERDESDICYRRKKLREDIICS